MGPRQLTPADRAYIVTEYQSWEGSTADLLEHLGIARQTLYDTLRRERVPTARAALSPQPSQQLADGMAREALGFLLEELVKARVEIGRLTAIVAAHGTE